MFTPLVMPILKEVMIPEIKKMPEEIEKMINENHFFPGDKDILAERYGFWYDEFKKSRDLFEFGWPTAVFTRKISPYNRLDKRFLVAEVYFNGADHEITTHFQENKEASKFKKFKFKGQFSEAKMTKLFSFVEEKYKDILETKQESEELTENFTFDKFINDIVLREEKVFQSRIMLAKQEEECVAKKLVRARRTNFNEKIRWK